MIRQWNTVQKWHITNYCYTKQPGRIITNMMLSDRNQRQEERNPLTHCFQTRSVLKKFYSIPASSSFLLPDPFMVSIHKHYLNEDIQDLKIKFDLEGYGRVDLLGRRSSWAKNSTSYQQHKSYHVTNHMSGPNSVWSPGMTAQVCYMLVTWIKQLTSLLSLSFLNCQYYCEMSKQ